MAQTATFNAEHTGLVASGTTLTAGQSQKAIFGFSVNVPSGSITFSKFFIGCQSTSENFVANGTLMRCSSNNFSTGTKTPVGNVTFNGGTVTISNLSETITAGNTNYYCLVVDILANSSSNVQFFINTTNIAIAQDINGTNYSDIYPSTNANNVSDYWGYNYTSGTPYQLSIKDLNPTGNLASNATTYSAATSDMALYAFSVTNTRGSSYTLTDFNIYSNIANLSTYFSSFSLYRVTTGSTYSTGNRTLVATGSINGSYVSFAPSSHSIPASTTYYYYLVGNYNGAGATTPASISFNITNGQAQSAIKNGSTLYNDATIPGNTYTFTTATINMAAVTSGLASSTIYAGQEKAAVFGFSMKASSGSATINQINIGSNNASLSTYFSTPILYESTSSSYNAASPGTALATGTFNGSYINFTGLNVSVTTSTTKYYYLVANVIYTGSGSTTFQFTNGQSTSALVQSSPASSFNTFNVSASYTISQPSFSVSNQTGGLISPTNMDYNQTGAVFGFKITPTGNTKITQLNFQADNGSNGSITVQNYFGSTATLYRAPTGVSSYSASNQGTAVGTVTLNGTTVTVAGLSETMVSGQDYYYFLVVNNIYASYTATASARFYMNLSNAIVISTGSSFNSGSNYGSGYTLNKRTVGYTFYDANTSANNITQGTIYPGQTGVVLYGFGISTDVATTINKFILNASYSGSSPQTEFNNSTAVLYSSSSSVFSTSTASPVSGASFTFANSSSPGVTISGFTQNLSSTPTYYFIVADVNLSSNTLTASAGTMQFKFEASQSNPISQTSPSTSNITVPSDMAGRSFPTSPPSMTVTGANTATNGITQGDITFGQSKIVLFGFKVVINGIYTINEINMQTTISGVALYEAIPTGTLYRSTDQYFSHAVPITGPALNFNQGSNQVRISSMSETLNSTTGNGTYWYFLVGNAPTTTSNNNYTAGSIKFQFDNGSTNMFVQTSPYKVINNISVSDGKTFTVANAYRWIGGASGHTTDFTWAGNFQTQNGSGAGSAPGFTGSTISVIIGTATYYPIINASTEIGGLTFASSAAQVTLNSSGVTLTLNKGLNVNSGSTANIVGPGKISTASASVSGVASTGTVKLTGGAEIANGGTFTLKSDASGSAAVDQLASGAKMSGSYNVERYITGGSTSYRGYRLLSSPTNISSSTTGGGNIDIGYLNNSSGTALSGALTGGPGGTGKGFSVTNTTPAIYFYREDVVPGTGTNAGKNKGVTAVYSSGATSSVDIATGSTTASSTNYTIPVGNGFIFYNIGSTGQSTNATSSTSSPANYTITSIGTLNQSTITFKNWYTAASTLSYTSSLTTNKGFNMVGNPYPCSLDLNTFYTDNSTNIQPSIYVLSTPGQTYVTYNGSTGAKSDPSASRYVASGQGMFVQAKSAGALLFKETQKAASQQLTGSTLLMGKPVNEASISGFFMKVEQDSVIHDYCGIYFDGDSDDFDANDAIDLDGSSPKVYMSSYTADGQRTAINSFSDYKNGKTIKLYVAATTNGLYKLKIEQIRNIDAIYDIWLKDNFKHDSLDLRSNDTYSFNVLRTDATTYGADRFQVIIRRKSLPTYQFISLSGSAVSSGVNLTWKTQNEYDFTGFTVERLNANKEYDPLNYIQSDGSGTYSFIDKNPSLGVNTYRIKQDDIDNNITYSTDVSVNTNTAITSNGSIIVYPSPATSTINVKFANQLTSPANVIVVNAMGDILTKQVFTQQQGIIDISKLKTGVYFLKCTNSGSQKEIGSQRFIKL